MSPETQEAESPEIVQAPPRRRRLSAHALDARKFTLQNIESAGAFLGYLSRYRHTNVHFNLVGTKDKTDIHSVNALRPALSAVLDLARKVACGNGSF